MAVEEPDSGVTGDLSIIVPCFNERPTIEVILRRLRDALPDAEIVVVDDGSTDGSREIATSLAEALRLRLICLETRGGKGAAVRAGVNAAGGEWIVIQDADLEYDPADLPGMLDAARLRSPCAVYGSRYLGRAAAPPRLWLNYIGVRLLAILEYVLYGIWLSDPHTCYKMLPASMIRQLNLRSNGFELCAEINSKLLRIGISIHEVPVSYRPRTVAEGKKIGLRDFFGSLWAYLKYRFADRPGVDSRSATDFSGWVYFASRTVAGLLLIVAGLSKLSPLQPLALTSDLIMPASAVFAFGLLEFCIGWACLTFAPHRLLHRIVAVTYSAFVVVLLLRWYDGQDQCPCLGSLSFPLYIMFAVDGVILGSLIWFRCHWDRWLVVGHGALGELVANLLVVFPVLVMGGVVWFGSLDAAYGYVSGRG